MVLSVPMGVVAMWSVDRFGLRSGVSKRVRTTSHLPSIVQCLLGAWANFAGNILRTVGSVKAIGTTWRFPLALTGQIIAASAQPFIMYLPTKLASFWFADSQRVIANTLGSMANPLGVAAMYAMSPQIVNDSNPEGFLLLVSVNFGYIFCAHPFI